MRWFQAAYLQDIEIQACLDAIIFMANSMEKNSAHITIRGPFEKFTDINDAVLEIKGTAVSVLGVGTFFGDNQNTVFLECGSEILKQIWWKPGYSFRPHITLYDGNSREFAEKLVNVLRRHNLFFSVTAGEVEVAKSIPGQKGFGLWFGIDPQQIRNMTGEEVNVLDSGHLPVWKRLNLIDRICTHLVWLAKGKESPPYKRKLAFGS